MKKKEVLRSLFIFIAIVVIIIPSYFKFFENFELATLDFRFNIRPIQKQNKDIAIIEIANDTLDKIGKWPIKRNWYAAIIDILSAYGARAIVFDTLFSEKTPEDAKLIESTRRAGNVYYAYSFELPLSYFSKNVFLKDKHIIEAKKIDTPLIPGLRRSARGWGFINVIPDIDGKTRRSPIFINYKGKTYSHLALLVARDYLGKDIRDINIPVDRDNSLLINYAGRWSETFKHYSFIDILKSYSLMVNQEKGVVDLTDFSGKVCFIGLTATGTHDFNPVPVEKRYPGLGIHVNLFNTIVTGNFLKRADRLTNIIILLILSFLIGLVTSKTRPFISFIFAILTIGVVYLLSLGLFVFFNIWIDLFYPLFVSIIIYLSFVFYRYVSESHKRELIEKELEVARRLQRSFLPLNPPDQKGISIVADMHSARQVGGDLYDFVNFSDGRVGIMIGDVSGKGVPAALYMARVVSLFRLLSRSEKNTRDVLVRLNESLMAETTTGLFVTLTYGIFDPEGMVFCFSSGGHLPILLLRKGKSGIMRLEAKKGIPLGIMPGDYTEERIMISKGDILILYTDGVTEAMNRKRQEFGYENLMKVLEENATLNAEMILEAIRDAVFKFSEHTPQHDDITIITIKVN